MTASRRAVLDIGSNTIRLLVAELQGNEINPILDDSDFVRLGRDVDRTGKLQPDRMDAARVPLEHQASRTKNQIALELLD